MIHTKSRQTYDRAPRLTNWPLHTFQRVIRWCFNSSFILVTYTHHILYLEATLLWLWCKYFTILLLKCEVRLIYSIYYSYIWGPERGILIRDWRFIFFVNCDQDIIFIIVKRDQTIHLSSWWTFLISLSLSSWKYREIPHIYGKRQGTLKIDSE